MLVRARVVSKKWAWSQILDAAVDGVDAKDAEKMRHEGFLSSIKAGIFAFGRRAAIPQIEPMDGGITPPIIIQHEDHQRISYQLVMRRARCARVTSDIPNYLIIDLLVRWVATPRRTRISTWFLQISRGHGANGIFRLPGAAITLAFRGSKIWPQTIR